jgi:hypothetical protein
MSYIQFQTRTKSVQVSGRERSLIRSYMSQITNSFVSLNNNDDALGFVKFCFPEDHYLYDYRRDDFSLIKNIKTSLSLGDLTLNHCDDTEFWLIQANTLISIGSDALKLLVKIYSQCEVHGFIEGNNRKWAASILQNALDCGLIRKNPFGYNGWDSLIELMNEDDDSPIVMSYSVADDFPTKPKKFDSAVDELRSLPGQSITPENLGECFHTDMNIMKLMSMYYAEAH